MKMLTVCINYADLLAETLKYSTKIFSDILVCTIASDKKTQQLCSEHPTVRAIVCKDKQLLYDAKKNDYSGRFNKARIMNKGLRTLQSEKYNGYLVLADADTIMPDFRTDFNRCTDTITKSGGDPKWMIFGTSRYVVREREMFTKWEQAPTIETIQKLSGTIGHEKPFTGYFQLFHFDHDPKYINPKISRDIEPNGAPIWLMNEIFTSTYKVDMWFAYEYIQMCKVLNRKKIIPDFKTKESNIHGMQFYTGPRGKHPDGHIVGAMISMPNMYTIHLGRPNVNRYGRSSNIKW